MKDGLLKKVGWNMLGIFAAGVFLAPLYIAFTNSFKTQKGLYLNVLGLPKGDTLTLNNYIQAFQDLDFIHL